MPSFEDLFESIKEMDEEVQARIKKDLTQLLEDVDRPTRDRLQKSIRAKWPELEEEILDHLLPEIRLCVSTDETLPSRGSSKVGGMPDMPPGLGWPQAVDGSALAFVAQVNLAECQGLEIDPALPVQGNLYLFCSFDEEALAAGKPGFALAFHPGAVTDLKPVDWPDEVDEADAVFVEAGLEFVQAWSVRDASLPKEVFEHIEALQAPANGRLGGQPEFRLAGPLDRFEPARHVLLLSLDAFGAIRWPGDSESVYGQGTFNLILDRTDLDAGRLDKARLVFEP